MPNKRQVRIDLMHGVWFVRYVSRRKRQHYSPAQFDSRDHTKADVAAWIAAKPNLELIP